MKRLILVLLFTNLAVSSSFALNPQPLPPGIAAKLMTTKLLPAVHKVMLNPQPLPPQK